MLHSFNSINTPLSICQLFQSFLCLSLPLIPLSITSSCNCSLPHSGIHFLPVLWCNCSLTLLSLYSPLYLYPSLPPSLPTLHPSSLSLAASISPSLLTSSVTCSGWSYGAVLGCHWLLREEAAVAWWCCADAQQKDRQPHLLPRSLSFSLFGPFSLPLFFPALSSPFPFTLSHTHTGCKVGLCSYHPALLHSSFSPTFNLLSGFPREGSPHPLRKATTANQEHTYTDTSLACTTMFLGLLLPNSATFVGSVYVECVCLIVGLWILIYT